MIARSLSALLFTKVRLPFPLPDTRFDILNFIKFMNIYGAKLSYGDLNKLVIRDLDFTFDVNTRNLDIYRIYFDVRDRMQIYRVGNTVFVEINGLKFIVPFPIGLWELKETFLDEIYKSECIKGKIVLDFGAFIGDTPIYFAKQNASHVFAYEASSHLFKIANQNIQLNDVSDKISLRNEALADTSGLVDFQYNKTWPGASTTAIAHWGKTGFKTVQVQGTTLNHILKETGDVGLLKMDIEGAEHQLISHACKHNMLDQIESMVIEVHGSNMNLMRVLQTDGYVVKVHRTGSGSLSLISAIRKRNGEY